MMKFDLHDKITSELLEQHALSALIYLIGHGRELEFSLDGKTYFLSRSGAKHYVSLWVGDKEQSFESLEDLITKAFIEDQPFIARWQDVTIELLY